MPEPQPVDAMEAGTTDGSSSGASSGSGVRPSGASDHHEHVELPAMRGASSGPEPSQGLRAEVPGAWDPSPQELAPLDRGLVQVARLPWRCYRCERPFAHARLMVDHLIRFHGEGPER